MRRYAPIGLALVAASLLPGCAYVGNPFDGFPGFIGDTHTFTLNPNQPAGSSTNLLRVQGNDVPVTPLLPEPGDVWPGPIKPPPTLADIQKEQNLQEPGGTPQPLRGSSTPPGSIQPNLPPLPNTAGPLPRSATQPAPPNRTFQTPSGPAQGSDNPGGPQTFTTPGGQQGIVVPNGNGTSTLISPDGQITTVPTPK